LAEARAIEAKGLAEAAAILKKAEAWKQFNEAAKLQAVLEKLPSVIESAAPVFAAIASPLGSIDKVVVIDQGNGSASSGITRFAQTSPSLVFNVLEQLKALNINLPELLGQLNGSAEAKKQGAG
jgi:flotillin